MNRRVFLERLAIGALATTLPAACSVIGSPNECRTTAQLKLLPREFARRVFLDENEPSRRWRELLAADTAELQTLCGEMAKEAMAFPHGPFVYLASLAAYPSYVKHGRYINESDLFADAGGISRSLMAFLQRQYTWSHALCTTASVWDPRNREMVMLRSLDWSGAKVMSSATRVHHFERQGAQVFMSVGITGMTGVLTAMKPGAFAAALNYAQVRGSARPAADPTLRLRELFEDSGVRSFRQAADAIQSWKLGAPCFISLTGIEPGEGMVIEFGGDHPHPRLIEGAHLVQTNHFDDRGPNRHLNQATPARLPETAIAPSQLFCAELVATSRIRLREAQQQLEALRPTDSLEQLALEGWGKPPLLNHETVHFAALRPRSAQFTVWRSIWSE